MKRKRGYTLLSLALAVILVLAASYGIVQLMEQRAHDSAEKLVAQTVNYINNKLSDVENVTRREAVEARKILDDPSALEVLVRDFVGKNEFVYGSTIAFEPDYFPQYGRSFAPYSWRTSEGIVRSRQLGTETDYYEEEWYKQTKITGVEYWCEPYFDEGGAKIMMCTFSVPLFTDRGQLVAIMTADVGLEDLKEYIDSITPSEDTTIVLRSANGYPLVNADFDYNLGSDNIIIKDTTKTGWAAELVIPFNYLMGGGSGLLISTGIILLITLFCVYFINRFLSRLQEKSSEEYKNVIDAISGTFSSIFLVDLRTGETVTFRTPENYEDVMSGAKSENFSAKLERLIEYDGYHADREKMHLETSLDTIRERLLHQDKYQVRFRKENSGAYRWYEMHVYTMESNAATGAAQRAVIAFTDVNESVLKEKETQDALEEALIAAKAASKAKTDFLFNMSHDIRTPMNAIIGFTNMAKKHIDEKDKVLDCLDKTQQSGNLLLALINSVLDVSRIESGHAKLEESPADVTYSFAAIQDTLTELATARDIELKFDIGEIKDRYVFCDLGRCNRIFVNIISNSIKYTHEGGHVNVSCRQLEDSQEGFGKYCYTFTDDGIGMSEEFQKKVFEQFSRETTSTISGIEGFGLGLAVCKSFVDLMGGTIECKSKLGEGTTFTVILPFRIQEGKRYIDPYTREEVNASDEKEIKAPVVFKGRKVLLVEDNELNLEIAQELLEEEGLVAETAENGSIAVEKMREKGPEYYDFILMDIQMPVMNGYEATKAIREMYPDAKIPIIAVSANAFEEDRRASRDAGMDDHVAKPVNVGELFAVLAKYL